MPKIPSVSGILEGTVCFIIIDKMYGIERIDNDRGVLTNSSYSINGNAHPITRGIGDIHGVFSNHIIVCNMHIIIRINGYRGFTPISINSKSVNCPTRVNIVSIHKFATRITPV